MNSLLRRISIDPNVCFGKPCIKGTRIWVSLLLDYLANGMNFEEILIEYQHLEVDDIKAAIAYGAEMARERYVDPVLHQTAQGAPVFPDGEVFEDRIPASAHLRCAFRIDLDELLAELLALVLYKALKHAPTRVMDGFRQVVVSHHVPDPEIFHHDDIVTGDQVVAFFMQEVLALVGDLLVTFRHSRSRFPAVCRPLLLAGEFALELGEALLGLPQEPGSIDSDSVRQGVEVEQSHIDADAPVNIATKQFRIRQFCCQVGIPLVVLADDVDLEHLIRLEEAMASEGTDSLIQIPAYSG
jgi:uncharacterized protein (DUF433 family)